MGQVQQVVNSWFGQSIRVMECPTCQGAGRKIEKPCRDCRGEGLLKKARDFDFSVPAGVESGSRIRLSGAGDKGRRGGPFGDLFIIVHVKEHEQFVRDGDTIHYNQPISFSMAALGGDIMVPTVEGEKLLKIAPGTQTGTMIVMKGLGVPRLGNPGRRGDELVHLTVTTPTKLSGEERKLLEKLAQLRSESLNVPADKSSPEAGSPATVHDKPSASTRQSEKTSKNGDDLDKQQDESQTKEDPSLFERIVEVFRPKNGEHEEK
jgi:molecular chaperone DnaJ